MSNGLRQFEKDFQRLRSGFFAQGNRQLLEHNDHADSRKHSVHDRRREKVPQHPRSHQPQHNLHDSRNAPDSQGHPVGVHVGRWHLPCGIAKSLHGSQHDHDQACSRPLNREFGIAKKCGNPRADNRRKHARNRRKSRCHGNPKTQWQRNEKHKKSSRHVRLHGMHKAFEISTRHLRATLLGNTLWLLRWTTHIVHTFLPVDEKRRAREPNTSHRVSGLAEDRCGRLTWYEPSHCKLAGM